MDAISGTGMRALVSTAVWTITGNKKISNHIASLLILLLRWLKEAAFGTFILRLEVK
jgi:hypothetical protein